MSLSLVVLAAGMGSRYGGLKQIDPVGPGGETVLDYAVYDALRAGFDRIVFVIRRDFEALFREKIGARYAGRAAVDYVFQSLDALPAGSVPPAGREKPWGTGHAVWCARAAIRGGFAVINADDFYGADSFRQLADFLRGKTTTDTGYAMVGFRLANTLSEHGTVARGVCSSDRTGALSSIVEQTGIAAADVGAGKKYTGEEIVSMNCWGFTPAFFAGLDAQFRAFLAERGSELKAEFYLPAAVSTLIARGEATVRVLPTESTWFGVTYREDKPRVEAAIVGLVQAGLYPAKLWA
ncbi:nucleotidyltransferase family protein [Horticoccus sp. 23ND18S-11]|uniref:nucleotidyltransferase family protein n=1 Tax=Horticoccus sp. 23ND18S-11 TaxID=3391832 RepID=UPI0039C9F66E